MKKLNLSAPWQIHRNKLAEVFHFDESVTVGDVVDSAGGCAVTISVSNHAKAAALNKLLKKTVEFGGVTLTVVVEDTAEEESVTELLKDAFSHNHLIRGVETIRNPTIGERAFVVIEPEIMQFWADNLADYRGNVSILAADAAQDVFVDDVNFCTAALNEN